MFLKGLCSRENCPYRHVNVSRNAALCEAFLKGYCPEGAACRLKHELPKQKNVVVKSIEMSKSLAVAGSNSQDSKSFDIENNPGKFYVLGLVRFAYHIHWHVIDTCSFAISR